MDKRLARMKSLLEGLVAGLGITGDHQITYNEQAKFFSLGSTGVEVALEVDQGKSIWRVLEVYDVNNFETGVLDPFGATVAEIPVFNDALAAKTAVMRLLERRIDVALETIV